MTVNFTSVTPYIPVMVFRDMGYYKLSFQYQSAGAMLRRYIFKWPSVKSGTNSEGCYEVA